MIQSFIYEDSYFRPFILTVDTNYTIVDTNYSLHKNQYFRSEIFNIKYNSTDSMYYSFYSIADFTGRSCFKIRLNSDLSLDSLYVNEDLPVRQPIYTESYSGGNYLLAREVHKEVMLYLLNSEYDTIRSMEIGVNNKMCYPAISRSLSANAEYLYAAITEDLNP